MVASAGLQPSMVRRRVRYERCSLEGTVKTARPKCQAGSLHTVANERSVETPPDAPDGPPVEEPPPLPALEERTVANGRKRNVKAARVSTTSRRARAVSRRSSSSPG
jgi:hypothetical protein